MKKILTILFLSLTLVGCNSEFLNSKLEYTPKEKTTARQRGDFSVKDIIPEGVRVISFDEVLEETTGTKVLFLSFDDCPYCYDALPILYGLTNEYGVELVYVDANREERIDGNETYDALRAWLGDLTGEEKTYIPCAIFLNDGGITFVHEGTVDSQFEENGEVPEITSEQKEELTEIYEEAVLSLVGE